METFLYNKLPRRIVGVNKKVTKKIEDGNKMKIYYQVITLIGEN
jgi:hypothetical protein